MTSTNRNGTSQIFDCDIHPAPKEGLNSLLPYMTRAWQERFSHVGDLKAQSRRHPLRYPNPTGSITRLDARPPGGGEPGSDPTFMVEDLLDFWKIDRGLLVPTPSVNAWTDPRLSAAYLSAMNDHFVHEWLTVDSRYTLTIAVSAHDPETAAAEIRRHAQTKRVVAVFMPMLHLLMGHRFYYPIYEAAQECGMPILLHPTGAEGTYQGAPVHAGGVATTYAERNVANVAVAMSHLSNLLFEGVFERFPQLKVVFTEWGFTWVPTHLWKLDLNWTRLRMDIPWVKRPPSEYVYEHVRFTTQPVEEPANPEHLFQIIDMMHGNKTLLFATDYPHWDNDDPFRVLTRLSKETRQAVYWENPMELFGARM